MGQERNLEVDLSKTSTGINDVEELETSTAVLRKDRMQWMNVEGMPVFSMWSSSFSLETVSYALLKSRSANTECFIGSCWKPSSISRTIRVI